MTKKLVGVLTVGLALRLISINQSLWLDEATTALVSQKTFGDYFTNFAPGDFHPPLYYLLSIAVANIFGTSELALRCISLFAGLMTIFIAYKIACKVSTKSTGIIAGLLLATSGLHIYYSQEARMYMLATLFASMSIYFFFKENWKLFGSSIIAMILTHYVTLFLLPVFWIYGYISEKNKNWWKQLVTSHLVLLIGFGLWIPVFNQQLTRGLGVESTTPLWWNILGKTTPKEIALIPAKFIFGRITIDNNFIYLLVTIGVIILYGAIIVRRPFKDRPLKRVVDSQEMIIWLWLLVPAFLTALMGIWIPVFSYFRLLFVLPAMFILLSFGIEKLQGRLKVVAVIFVLLVNIVSSGVYLFNPRFQREDWKELEQFVWNQSKYKDTQLVFVTDSQMEAYSYYFYNNRSDRNGHGADKNFSSPDVLGQDLDTIFLMRYVQPIFDPEDTVREKIESLGYHKTSEHDFNGIVVWRYDR